MFFRIFHLVGHFTNWTAHNLLTDKEQLQNTRPLLYYLSLFICKLVDGYSDPENVYSNIRNVRSSYLKCVNAQCLYYHRLECYFSLLEFKPISHERAQRTREISS